MFDGLGPLGELKYKNQYSTAIAIRSLLASKGTLPNLRILLDFVVFLFMFIDVDVFQLHFLVFLMCF